MSETNSFAWNEITREIPDVIEDVSIMYNLSKKEGTSVLDRLARSGDTTQLGLSRAITNVANKMENYDRIIEFERIGGKVLDLTKVDWAKLAEEEKWKLK